MISLEDTPGIAKNSWQMAQATGLTHKTIEKMRARIYAAVGSYRGPNKVFGRRVSRYVREQRPSGYQRPPKIPTYSPSVGAIKKGYESWYAWRARHPLGKRIEAAGVLAELDSASREDLGRTERLLMQILSARPASLTKRRRKSKKLPARHLGWLKAS